MEEGGKDAAEKFGIEFIYTGPTDTNPADQLRVVNGLIDQGVKAVSLSVPPTVNFGPGDPSQAHQPNESVTVADLVTTTKIIALTIAKWCR